MEYVLETKNLNKNYKNFKALHNLNIHVPSNSIYGLIGKNGAGKTTLIRIICGLQNIDGGEFYLYNKKNNSKEFIKSQKRLGAIIEHPAIYENLSARDNLEVQCKIVGVPTTDNIDYLLELVNLKNTNKKIAKFFSLGMKQRLGIAMSLVGNPDFLILDEPINGLDPEGIIEMRELLLKLNKEENLTILISSHYLDELSKIATYYGFIDNGVIIKEISKQELETSLKKKVLLKVNNSSDVIPVLEEIDISYDVINDMEINLYGEFDIQNLLYTLKNKSIKVLEIKSKDETLESYFINLLGGDTND